ncbi:MAG: hypothetical protein M1831_001055 [Alyxoria varia]|nr:MAG: hypothetical protein M1831_001055 [Alyxoria varia]
MLILLVATGELSNESTASQRGSDTGVLIMEFALNKPSSERARTAISRMNYLHSRYQKAGKISNDDMLYTLSLFALEPVRWIDAHEWRQLTDLERCAFGTFWKSVGDAMGISFERLPSSHCGWWDGMHWLEEARVWSEAYEKAETVPNELNRKLAAAYLNVLHVNVPKFLVPVVREVVSVLFGARLQQAVMLPDPSNLTIWAVNTVFSIRKLVLRHLSLPRPEFLRVEYISARPDPVTKRIHTTEYAGHPWYVKPTAKARWEPMAWVTWILGGKLPGDDGNRYAPEGYLPAEVGPSGLRRHGGEAMLQTERKLVDDGFGKCPFSIYT